MSEPIMTPSRWADRVLEEKARAERAEAERDDAWRAYTTVADAVMPSSKSRDEVAAQARATRLQRDKLREALLDYVDDDECKYGMDEKCDPDEVQCRRCAARAALEIP